MLDTNALNRFSEKHHIAGYRQDFRGRTLDKKEAMAMLKELIVNNLVDPSYVHICLRKPENITKFK